MMRARLRFLILTGLAFLPVLPLCAQQKASGKQPILKLDFQNAETSNHYRSTHLVDRFKTIARATVPPEKNAWNVQIELADPKGPQGFSIVQKTKRRDLTVTVPYYFNLWRHDAIAHKWLMSKLILANLGEKFAGNRFSQEEHVIDHWLVAGLARKAGHAGNDLQEKPFSRTFPGAFTLTSNGIHPGLKRILHSPYDPGIPDPVQEICAEYDELLIDALSQAGFFRKRMAEPLLRTALLSPDVDPYESFLKVVEELNLRAPGSPADKKVAADQWFEAYTNRTLISLFSPLSAEFFETSYRRIATLQFTDSDGIKRQCRITEVPENWTFFKDGNAIIDDLIARLNLLAFQAPQGFQDALGGIRLALIRCRTEQTPEVTKTLREAEKKLFEVIAVRVAAERVLASSERRSIPPSGRLDRTLDSQRSLQSDTRSLVPSIQKILDPWDEYR